MTPAPCPFSGCVRYAGHPGDCIPVETSTTAVTLEADACWLRVDGTCGRVGHPTPRSDCRRNVRG